jgi:hypothetical protein
VGLQADGNERLERATEPCEIELRREAGDDSALAKRTHTRERCGRAQSDTRGELAVRDPRIVLQDAQNPLVHRINFIDLVHLPHIVPHGAH